MTTHTDHSDKERKRHSFYVTVHFRSLSNVAVMSKTVTFTVDLRNVVSYDLCTFIDNNCFFLLIEYVFFFHFSSGKLFPMNTVSIPQDIIMGKMTSNWNALMFTIPKSTETDMCHVQS